MRMRGTVGRATRRMGGCAVAERNRRSATGGSVAAGAVGDAFPRGPRRHARGVPLQRRAAAHALVLLAQLRFRFLERTPVATRGAEVADAVRRLVILVDEIAAHIGFIGER